MVKKKLTKHQTYFKRQKAKGLALMSMWIPIEDTKKAKAYGNRLRIAHEKAKENKS